MVRRNLDEAAERLGDRLGINPTVGVVLGSGLGRFADVLEEPVAVPFTDVPHMSASGVAGHAGQFFGGRLSGTSVLCASGRLHAYEGHPLERVVLPVRLMARLGCRAVLLTNAAGGIRADLGPGSFMLIADHLNLTGRNPLVAHPHAFVDMTDAYSPRLRALAREASERAGVDLAEGVYAGLLGPTYETPAEVRMLRALGADAVGMSTVLETIALRAENVEVAALSCITNHAAGTGPSVLEHGDVQAVASGATASLSELLAQWLVLVGRAEQEGASSG